MDDPKLERILEDIGHERFAPPPDLVCRTKGRLHRSRLLPWLLFGSLALQFLTACASVFVLASDALSWAQKLGGLAVASLVIGLFLLPLVALKDQMAVFFEGSDRTPEHC
jgi:hypothetical protein